jgi:hypothetical protein
MQALETQSVACPECGDSVSVTPPSGDVELKVSGTLALYGDHVKVSCSQAHTFWVYFC